MALREITKGGRYLSLKKGLLLRLLCLTKNAAMKVVAVCTLYGLILPTFEKKTSTLLSIMLSTWHLVCVTQSRYSLVVQKQAFWLKTYWSAA